jgi:hypothetical protein
MEKGEEPAVATRAGRLKPAPPTSEAAAPPRLRGVTARAVIIAFILLVLFAPAGYYGELVYGSTYMFASGVPSMGSLVALFLLTLANTLINRMGLRGLSRREVLTCYVIVLVGGPLMTHGILAWMIGHNLTPRLVARAIPEWQRTFLLYTPDWFVPTNADVVESYYQGQSAVPWGQWAVPLAAWSSFMVALFVATLSLVLLFRNQWITHERLAFPVAQVPLELIRDEETAQGPLARLPGGSMFWIGFGVVMAVSALNTLSGLVPAVPSIPLYKTLMQWIPTGPLAGVGGIDLDLDPTLIGIAYLIPKELSFSCWFFYFLRVGETVAAVAGGATPQAPEGWYGSSFPAPYYQGGGAAMALGLWVLWVGRRHLARAFRLALSGRADPDDPRAPMTYRWLLAGFLLAFAYMVYFCMLVGTRVWVAAIMCGLIVAYYVMWARMRAETGLGILPFPLGVEDMMLIPAGSAALRPKEIVNLISLRWTYFPGFGESYEVVPGNGLEAFKIADTARLRERPLLGYIVIGFLISLAAGLYVLLTGMYHYGFYNINAANSGWLQSQMRGVGGRMHEMLTNPSRFDLNGLVYLTAGAAVAIVLGVLRLRFWWWPLHPFGYLAANCWGMHWYWQAFFIGWIFKSLAIRYGGLQLYRRTVPMAIGVIMGSVVGSGLHVLVSTVVKSQM